MKRSGINLFMFLVLFVIGILEGFSQTFESVQVHLDTDPITLDVTVQSLAGYQGRIESYNSGDENNTQIVEMYYEHCIPFLVFYVFDTTFTIDATFPFDLLIYTYMDTVSVSEDPVCTFEYNTIIPVDTFFLAADQILSSSDFRESANGIKVYPVPTEDFINVDVPTELIISKFTILDMSGRLISDHNPSEKQIDLTAMPAGLYLLRIETDQGTTTRKIIRR